jgi:PAS domain-containing protein
MASRLSYFLTNSAPDEFLLAAAEDGRLLTRAGLEQQTTRLLDLPAARQAFRHTIASYWSLDALDALSRPAQVFPTFTSTLGPSFKEEVLRTVEDVIFDRDADVRELFDQRVTFVNAELSSFYGWPALSGSGFSKVTRPDGLVSVFWVKPASWQCETTSTPPHRPPVAFSC